MKNANIFFIKTPLQLLNAIELRNNLLFSDLNILVIITLNGNSYKQLMRNCYRVDWDLVITIIKPPNVCKNKLINSFVVKIYNFLQKYKWQKRLSEIKETYKIKSIVTGNYLDPIFNIAISNCLHDEIIAVDDGLATISIVKQRKEELERNLSSFYCKNNRLFNLFFRIKKLPCKKIIFFSMFNLNVESNDRYIKNEFSTMRTGTKKYVENAFVIGGPFLSKRIIPALHYFRILENVKKMYPDYNFFYLPHRQESERDLLNIQKVLPVIRSNEPLEMYCARMCELPSLFVGFYSTALVTLKCMFGNSSTNFISIKTEFNLSNKQSSDVNEVYKILESEYDIAVVDL